MTTHTHMHTYTVCMYMCMGVYKVSLTDLISGFFWCKDVLLMILHGALSVHPSACSREDYRGSLEPSIGQLLVVLQHTTTHHKGVLLSPVTLVDVNAFGCICPLWMMSYFCSVETLPHHHHNPSSGLHSPSHVLWQQQQLVPSGCQIPFKILKVSTCFMALCSLDCICDGVLPLLLIFRCEIILLETLNPTCVWSSTFLEVRNQVRVKLSMSRWNSSL